MIQCRGGLGFLDKAPLAVAVSDFLCRQHLESNQAVKAPVQGLIDNTHAAFADLLEDFVVRDGAPDHARLHLQQRAKLIVR